MLKSAFRATSAVCLLAMALFGQGSSSLNGTVSDPQGAVVPNAKIVLENTERGLSREVESDSNGRYTLAQVPPGRYKVTAKAPGFSDVAVSNVTLAVNQPSTLDIRFEKVGSVTETISVSAEGTQINTTDASVGNAIGTKPILQLPLFARNLASLLAFQPGVTSFAEVSGTPLDDRSGAVNGGKSDQSNITMDGVDVNQQSARTAFTSVLRATLDSTQEFRTTTSGATADQGRSSGAQVALVTRSGTNELHGSLYHVHRNTITAANTFFNNASSVKRAPLLINIPGGRIGGPIQKNKAFYMFNYEGRRDASSANVSRTVPSMLMRQGSIQYLNNARQVVTIGPAELRAIDPAGIGPNAAALQLLQSFPEPNDFALGDGLNIVGYRFSAPIRGKQDTYIAKFDYVLDEKHSFFWRGNMQNDRDQSTPQFPGLPPNSVNLTNAKGHVIGHTALIKPNFVSSFRYGLTRQSFENTGVQTASAISFRNISDRFGLTRGVSRQLPVHHITQDFNWTKGSHDVKFGGSLKWIENRSRNYNNSFNAATTNVSWLRGTGSDLQPADLLPANRTAYGDAAMAVLGIVSQVTARFNFNVDGQLIPTGSPVRRDFRNEEYEMYVQDSWRVKRNLTVTAGLRYSLMPPIYEANGQQLSTNIPIGDWFNTRGGLAAQGKSQAEAGLISYVTHQNGRPIYPYYKGLFAPRFSLAWSPGADSGFLKWLTGGPGKSTVRAGWNWYYDAIGQPLTFTYDANAFGLATGATNPSGQQTSLTAPRFTGLTNFPAALVPAAPRGGFPATPPASGAGSFAITNSIDDKLKMPYVMRMNFSLGREFKGGLFIEGSYVSSLSRRSIINRDLAMPTNLIDPASKQSYFQAASYLALALRNNVPVGALQAQPFFENFFRNLATGSRTATQSFYQDYVRFYPNDFTSALADGDQFCDPSCGISKNQMMNAQFSALSAWSSIGSGNYHAMQWVVRKRFSNDLTVDFNYSFAKSIDLASRAENAGSFAGFLVNSWEPRQRRAVSDYDQRHVYNAYAIWELPFGKGKRWGSSANPVLRQIIGGWQLAPTWQQSTELPTSVGTGRNWPTNWNITSLATPNRTPPAPTKTGQMLGLDGRVAAGLYSSPQAAFDSWSFTLPGQTGSRNTTRVDGVFSINLGVGKRFEMPWENHSLQFRWETFNLTNTNRFNGVNLDLGTVGAFGRYTSSLSSPRQMQFLLRYEF